MAERVIEYERPRVIAFSTPSGLGVDWVREIFLRSHVDATAEFVAERWWLQPEPEGPRVERVDTYDDVAEASSGAPVVVEPWTEGLL